MGLLPSITGSGTITTSPTNIDSTGYFYHHITIFITSTIGIADQFNFDVYTYNSITGTWFKDTPDPIDYTSTENGTIKSIQVNPRPGHGLRVTLTKVAGANLNFDYEIVKTQ